jgi:hypothetical protein
MLEVFEKHLADIEISKRFEKAKTKEEKIAACTKYLEDNDFEVRIRGQYTHSNPAENVYGKISAGGLSNHGTLTIDANVMHNLVIGGISGTTIVDNTSKIEYLTAKKRVTQEEIEDVKDPLDFNSRIIEDLRESIKKELDYKMRNNPKCVIKDKDYLTGDVLYAIKIGVVQ